MILVNRLQIILKSIYNTSNLYDKITIKTKLNVLGGFQCLHQLGLN